MENREKGFTLIELLSVIVILGITFMFILPSLTELFTMGNKTEIELIEERVLSAAKEYVNNVDGSFYTKLYKEGDVNYIYKSDLINAGLISNEEISKLNTFAGVKGEVLKNDRIRYTVEYINASNNEYTNEELYLMIKNLQPGGGNVNNEEIENLKSRIEELEETTLNMSILKAYPVGSIYMSANGTNPGELFGGEWEQLKDRFLLGAGDTYTAGSTGGSTTHQHKYGFQYGGYYSSTSIESNANAGLLDYFDASSFSITGGGNLVASYTAQINNNATTSNKNISMEHHRIIANTSATSTLPPYITVYMWKRTA